MAERLFGIKLLQNFNSPYKSTNITEFWRRWHMTLSRFLRDYLYIPLGGNRKGPTRRCVNVMITMLLGGLWHGAGWTFVFWGGLHGFYLMTHQAWQLTRQLQPGDARHRFIHQYHIDGIVLYKIDRIKAICHRRHLVTLIFEK